MSKSRLDEYLESPGPQSTPDQKKLELTQRGKLRWSKSSANSTRERWKQNLLSESKEDHEGGKLQTQDTSTISNNFTAILANAETAQIPYRSQKDVKIEWNHDLLRNLALPCENNLVEPYWYGQKSNFGNWQVVEGADHAASLWPREPQAELLSSIMIRKRLKAARSSCRRGITDSQYNNHELVPVAQSTISPTSGLPLQGLANMQWV